ARRGHAVRLCQRGGRFRGSVVEHDGVVYEHTPTFWDDRLRAGERAVRRARRLAGRPEGRTALNPMADLDYGRRVANTVRRHGCDVVHVCITDWVIPIIRRRNPDAAIIIHMHDHVQTQEIADLVHPRLAQADLVVGVSAFLTAAVAARFPDIADKCVAAPNPADAHLYDPVDRSGRDPSAAPELLFVGRLSPEKGVHTLIKAFEIVRRTWPDARLRLAGPDTVAPAEFVDPDGTNRFFDDVRHVYDSAETRRAFARDLRVMLPEVLRDNLIFAGVVDHGELRTAYERADLFAFPSLWDEPFGLPVVEAMSSCLPVIATRAGAFPETVAHGETGLLVERGDPAALAAAISALLADRGMRLAMGRAGRARVEALFSWDRYIDTWEELYARAIANRRRARNRPH
ncbi:MAG: glycosyltransferase family 4 protein, partial [Caulobacterales bacterium]|nr:glycosyltransferase family 4 protein [Caulobacterales bacterium]